jgi:hypothetical protein
MFQLGQNSRGLVVLLFENPKVCYSEARPCRARKLLFRCWQQADSPPIELASE